MKIEKFYHFSIFNFEVKIEMRKNVLFHFNFKLKIEWHFRCTDFSSLFLKYSIMTKFKNQNFEFHFLIYQKKPETILWVHDFYGLLHE